jgi:meiotic recombination protein REC8
MPRPFESVDHPSRLPFGGLGRHGGGFPSSSPLAGRSLAFGPSGHDRLSSLSFDGLDGLDDLEMNDVTNLEGYAEHSDHSNAQMQPNNFNKQQVTVNQEMVPSLGQADRNFLQFLQSHFQMHDDDQPAETATAGGVSGIESRKSIALSALLPPSSTSRIVATQGLMHILALATNDLIAVAQAKTIEGPPRAVEDLGDIYLTTRHSGR